MNWGLPPNMSTFGDIDSLYKVILMLTGTAFVLTEGALVLFLFRYRARDGGKAHYEHGNHRLELIWTILPGVILFGLAIYQYGSWIHMKRDFPSPAESVQVELSPKQFLWAPRYPGPDNMFDTEDDIVAPNNVINVPVGEPVLVTLNAEDVIHSFFVPELRVKQDALPGTLTHAWFEATTTGTYEVVCAELCGLGHYRMRAQLNVQTREDFDAWLATQAAAGAPDGQGVASASLESQR